jgi:hypothetical protein
LPAAVPSNTAADILLAFPHTLPAAKADQASVEDNPPVAKADQASVEDNPPAAKADQASVEDNPQVCQHKHLEGIPVLVEETQLARQEIGPVAVAEAGPYRANSDNTSVNNMPVMAVALV